MNVRLVGHCLFVLVVCLIATARLLAQGEAAVHGTVTARADGSALRGAIVEPQGAALPAPMRVATGADGHFAFARLAPGEYGLTLAHADFSEQRYRLSLKPRETYNLDAALVIRPVQESVNVAADPLPSVHSPGSTNLSGTRLSDIPLTQRTNLPDAIVTAAPGMIRGHDDFVHIRGHEVALNTNSLTPSIHMARRPTRTGRWAQSARRATSRASRAGIRSRAGLIWCCCVPGKTCFT